MLVGLLEAELLGCCEDMALKISTEEDQSVGNRRQRMLVLDFIGVNVLSGYDNNTTE